MNSIAETVVKRGQKFVDDPVYIMRKKEEVISKHVRRALGDFSDPEPLLVGHKRVGLRWMKPDGRGGIVPTKSGRT